MTAALRLYEIVDALEQIGDELTENGGTLTPELVERLDALEGAFEEKVERTALYMKNIEATAAAAENEAHRLAELARSRRSAIARLKEYLKTQMELARIPKVETARIVARIQKNSRPSISCAVPIEQLPEHYVRVTRAFDNNVAYEAWKAGARLPDGVIVEVGSHLRVS